MPPLRAFPTPRILLSGRAKSAPDEAYISLTISATRPTPREADADAAQAMLDLKKSVFGLESAHLDDASLATRSLSLYPETQGRQLPDGTYENFIKGYTFRNSIDLTISSAEGKVVSAVVDACVSGGGSHLHLEGISFGLSHGKREAALKAARAAAVEDARTRAETYAAVAGLRVGAVLEMREPGLPAWQPQPLQPRMAMLKAAEAATPVHMGEQGVTASVIVHFALVK